MHPDHATGLKPNSPTGKRVLLLIESSRSYGRGLLKGIASYLRAHPNWDVLHLERGLNEGIPEQINRQSFDGVIARIENRQLHQSITEMGVPAVDLRANFESFGGTSFDTDPAACAHLAVEHFRERGHRNLAYCGYSGLKFSDQRCDAFVDQAQANGLNIFVYNIKNKRNKKTQRHAVMGSQRRDS